MAEEEMKPPIAGYGGGASEQCLDAGTGWGG